MDEIEKITSWILTFPQWPKSAKLEVDHIDPGGAGLFPLGLQEIRRDEDLLGNQRIVCRWRALLVVSVDEKESGMKSAAFLTDFEKWVYEQNGQGVLPRLGDGYVYVRAENGQRVKIRQPGLAVYSTELSVEFTKYYEVRENG